MLRALKNCKSRESEIQLRHTAIQDCNQSSIQPTTKFPDGIQPQKVLATVKSDTEGGQHGVNKHQFMTRWPSTARDGELPDSVRLIQIKCSSLEQFC